MYQAIPTITESADQLRTWLQREFHPTKQRRIHALYLLASGQATTRQQVADLLGASRNTVGTWLARYAAGGLDALLHVYTPKGRQSRLSAEVRSQLQRALQQPDGFASYDDVRVWLERTHGVSLKYKTVHQIVRYQLKAKLKVARPAHIKKR